MKPSVLIDVTSFDDPQRDIAVLEGHGVIARVGTIGNEIDASIRAIVVGNVQLTDDILQHYPNLELISRYGTGIDNISLSSGNPVLVRNVDGYATESVATHTIGMLIAASRLFLDMDRTVRQRSHWKRPDRPIPAFASLRLGIVGYGRIGSRVAHNVERMVSGVVAMDPYVDHFPPSVDRATDLEELLASVDAVSFHVPLTDETRGMFGAAQIDRLGADGVVVNTSRGAVVDADTVATALESGRLRAAALDVLPVEPAQADAAILQAPRVILTPHVGWMTAEAEAAMRDGALNHVLALFHGSVKFSAEQGDSSSHKG